MPLSTLRKAHPSLSDRLASKYKGREAVPRRRIPELDCRWEDCVQFSTVHPANIRDAMIRAGHAWPDRGVPFLQVRADTPVFSKKTTVIWLFTDTGRTDFTKPKTDVIAYSPDAVTDLTTLQAGTEAYLQEMKLAGRRPLLFVGVPHVLHRGEVPLTDCEEIVV